MTKQVSLADDTYARLRRSRRPGESFSQTINRLLEERAKDPLGFSDRVPKAKISTKKWLEEIDSDREDTRVDA